MMTIEELKSRKKQLHYTNEQIAQLSGVPLGTVQKIFGGATSCPRYGTMLALELALSEDAFAGVCETPAVYGTSAAEDLPRQGSYTVEDYRALPDWPRYELIDGELIRMEAPTTEHQGAVGELFYALKTFVRSRSGSCRVFVSPVDVQLDCDEHTMVQPDVLVVCDADKVQTWGIWGAPDLVIEVVSPSSVQKDMIKKLHKYRDAGVREYWIIDPKEEIVLTYFFEDGVQAGIYGFDSRVPVRIYGGELEIDFAEVRQWM